MASGVYFIRHRESGKMYIGSAQRIDHRLKTHQWRLERNQAVNSRLAAAFKHSGGWSAFETGTLEECSANVLAEREQHWVDLLKPRYNIRRVVESSLGTTHSDEAIARKRAWVSKPENHEALSARLAGGRKIRWETPGAAERQSQALRAARAKKARTYEDIQALVAEADSQWVLQSVVGTKTKDKITIYCAKHDATHVVTVNMLVARKQGCRMCGWERSSAKQKGVVKPSSVARWDREGRKTVAQLKAEKRNYDRRYRLWQKEWNHMAKRPPQFEGSPKDVAQDKKGAKKLGVGLRAYERTGRDKAEDKAGQKAGRFGRK